MKQYPKIKLAVFAFDINEVSQIRRIQSFIAMGHETTSYSMRRKNMNCDFAPSWKNHHLGDVENGNLLKRMAKLITACRVITKKRKDIARADRIIARNFDMLLLALFAKLLVRLVSRRSLPVVYECLDIHSIFTQTGFKGKVARKIEHLSLNFVERIVVSAPAFETQYFEPFHGAHYDIRIVENKLVFGANKALSARCHPSELNAPIRIGLVGTIRCPNSVDLLLALARRYSNHYEIHLHGVIHHHAVKNLEERVSESASVYYHGAYAYPNDLQRIYGQLDYVWAQDLWQMDGNSRWLLPNRIYEAGYFGCPAIALGDTETGAAIERMGTGITCAQATVASLNDAIMNVTPSSYQQIVKQIASIPTKQFVLDHSDLAQFIN